MKIEALVDNMNAYLKDGVSHVIPNPCTEDEIAVADTYKRIMRRSNGVLYNGLVIWPVKSESLFQETIHQANSNLRESFSDEYIYFAQKDEEFYVFDIESQQYCAIEFVGMPIWKRFTSADEMYLFMLKRAWE